MTIWEHKVVPMSVPTRNCESLFEDCLNKHGVDGWEIFHVGIRSMYDSNVKQTFMFKRPKIWGPPKEAIEEDRDPIDLLLEGSPQGDERAQILAVMSQMQENMATLTTLYASDAEDGNEDLLDEMIAQGEAITGLRDDMGAAPLSDFGSEDTSPKSLTPLPEVRKTRGTPPDPDVPGEEG